LVDSASTGRPVFYFPDVAGVNFIPMHDQFRTMFTLQDGSEVQVKEETEGCYQFLIVRADATEDPFTWDATETSGVTDSTGLNTCERRRNESLQKLWEVVHSNFHT
jgi:hypothetical protein